MIKKLLVISLLFIGLFSFAQTNWEPLNPKPSYYTAADVEFVNADTGYIINNKQLLQTVDGGTTWSIKMDLNNATDIQFRDNIGYITGNSGLLLKSSDYGETWTYLPMSSTYMFNSISIIDEYNVIISTNNTIVKSNDGGSTFTYLPLGLDYSYTITKSFFTDALTGHVAFSNGYIKKTVDGGQTWYDTVTSNVYPSDFTALYFVDQNNGFASHLWDTLLKTADGGETWTEVGTNITEDIYSINFVTSDIGYACGEFNTVYKTTDGGSIWVRLNTPDYLYETSHLYGIYAIGTNVYTVGMSGGIYRSANSGASFSRYSPTYREIKKITFADANTAYALSINSDIYKSTDSGNSWQYASSIFNTYASAHDLVFVSATTGYTILAGGLEKTTDGGLTWNFTNIINDNLYSVAFIDTNTGFVSGGYNGPVTKKTTDGGATWQTVNNLRFGKMQFLNATIGYTKSAGYYTNKMYKTIDGGATWTEIYAVDESIYDFDFIDENTGYFAGNPGIQRKTTDGGATWQEMPALDYMYTSIIRFADTNTGYAISDYGVIYKTTNGGESWMYDGSIRINDLVYHNGYAYAGGTGGKILGKPSGILTIPEAVAKSETFSVYPNPASTSFTVATETSAISCVQLYDIAGRKLTLQDIAIDNKKASVKLPTTTAGLYIVNIILTNGSFLSQKIIIK